MPGRKSSEKDVAIDMLFGEAEKKKPAGKKKKSGGGGDGGSVTSTTSSHRHGGGAKKKKEKEYKSWAERMNEEMDEGKKTPKAKKKEVVDWVADGAAAPSRKRTSPRKSKTTTTTRKKVVKRTGGGGEEEIEWWSSPKWQLPVPKDESSEEEDPDDGGDPADWLGKPSVNPNDEGGSDDDSDGAARPSIQLKRPRVDPISSDSDDNLSIASIQETKPNEPDLTLRNDKFMRFLTLACGAPAMTRTQCFVAMPPETCTRIDQYKLYLASNTRAALAKTNTFIRKCWQRVSGGVGNLTLKDCIENLPEDHDLLTSTSEFMGMCLRKTKMDNPTHAVATNTGSREWAREMIEVKKQIIRDLMCYRKEAGSGRFSLSYAYRV